jgi:trk system potassium uptake protein TrkA
MTLAADSPVIGKRVDEVNLPSDTALVAILRGPSVIAPTADDRFEPGDELLFVAGEDTAQQLEVLLSTDS